MKVFLTILLLLTAAGRAIAADAGKPAKSGEVDAVVDTSTNPALESDRKIAPQDILEISVVGEKDLDKILISVGVDGDIEVPYLKPISAAGKTPTELRKYLKGLWQTNEIFIEPQVLLRVAKYRDRLITVTGRGVMKPGVYPLPTDQPLDVLGGIALGGGLSATAKESQIMLNRPGKGVQRFKYDDLIKITDPAKKIYLQSEDIITVGEAVF